MIRRRCLFAFIAPTILDAEAFLAKKGHSASDAERMHRAWSKSAVLHITL
jgi:hypothetical protein